MSDNKYYDFHEWNRFGRGTSASELSAGEWYRGPVYYIGDNPASRYVTGPKGKKVELVRAGANTGSTPQEYRQKLLRLSVMDIGVFSRYHEDWVSEEDLHDRLRFLYLARIQEFCDRYTLALEGRKLVEEEQNKHTYNPTEKRLRDELKKYYADYNSYSKHFDLNWKEPPTIYKEKFEQIIADKKRAWLDPFAVARRERQAARREAAKALGLDD